MARVDLTPRPEFYSNPVGQNDQIHGLGGNDTIWGNDGSDDLFGGNGDDWLNDSSSDSSDRYYGGAGNDRINAGIGDSRALADGGTGIDIIELSYRTLTPPGETGIRAIMGSVMQVNANEARGISVLNCEVMFIEGSAVNDTLYGGEGNDTISGQGGADLLRGNDGDDRISVFANNTGRFDARGGAGIDLIEVNAQNERANMSVNVNGTMLFDGVLEGSAMGFEALWLYAGTGNDTAIGGARADYLNTAAGNDVLDGGAGDDTLLSGSGADTLSGGSGRDELTALGDVGLRSVLYGGDEYDAINGGRGNDLIYGGNGGDLIFGGDGIDTLFGGAGNDGLNGGLGNVVSAYGGEGDDNIIVWLRPGLGTVTGGNGTDSLGLFQLVPELVSVALRANVENGVLFVRRADGTLVHQFSGFESYTLAGGDMADRIAGGAGNDRLFGGNNFPPLDNDTLYGLGGDDLLNAYQGNDQFFGGTGNDRIFVGLGNDRVTTGTGRDELVLNFPTVGEAAANTTTVTDFTRGRDKFDLRSLDADTTNTVFDDAFRFIGRAAFSEAGQVRAVISNGRTIVTGDSNGDGVADFRFVLTSGLALTASDFML